MLTDTTKTGENTLSFLLNDEVWIADRGWGDMSSTISLNSKTWLVSTRNFRLNEGTDNFGISLTLSNWDPNIYKYSEQVFSGVSTFSFGKEEDGCLKRFETNNLDSFNQVEITHIQSSQTNALEQWISGTFQFHMVEKFEGGCGDTITINNGRFDMRFQAI